jgi:hypothetical protein
MPLGVPGAWAGWHGAASSLRQGALSFCQEVWGPLYPITLPQRPLSHFSLGIPSTVQNT